MRVSLPRSNAPPGRTPHTPQWEAKTWELEQKVITVPPGKILKWPLWVNPEWRNAKLVGKFQVEGGRGNDIEAIVTDKDGFTNWSNNQWFRPRTWYRSGRLTADSLSVALPAGHSVLAFDNRFSTFSNKAITLDLKIEYEQLTYP